ncbi:c-type cytochrome [Candidatus Nitrospira salsa]
MKTFFLGTLPFAMILVFFITELGHTKTEKEGGSQSPKSPRGHKVPKASSPSMEQITQGKTLYEGRARCVHCHGHKAVRRELTDQELFSIIKFGVPGTSHIAFKYLLSDEEVWSIVYYQLRNNLR